MSMQVKSINYCKHHIVNTMEFFYVTEANLSEKYSCTICLASKAAKISCRAA